MPSLQIKFQSKIAPLYLVASETGLQGLYWTEQNVAFMPARLHTTTTQILNETQSQIEQYLTGQRKTFNLPLDINGTEFQKTVWRELMKIPYGKTFSYSEIAKKIKNDKAVRAVGTANGRNPICLIVPCHRVIAADGTLGGYVAGLEIKEKLLRLERTGTL